MTSPIPALKPTRTGSEIKLATNPRRNPQAARRTAPVRSVSVADTVRIDAASPALANCPTSAATRMASVVVVLTLSRRDVPSSAYRTMGARTVYRPTCNGRPAMDA